MLLQAFGCSLRVPQHGRVEGKPDEGTDFPKNCLRIGEQPLVTDFQIIFTGGGTGFQHKPLPSGRQRSDVFSRRKPERTKRERRVASVPDDVDEARFTEGPSDGVDVFAVERRFVMGYVEGLDEFKLEAKFLVRETEASSMKRSSVVPERGTPTITGIGGSSVGTPVACQAQLGQRVRRPWPSPPSATGPAEALRFPSRDQQFQLVE
jgi:hypothetical protein